MDKAEFCARFKASMTRMAPFEAFEDGYPVSDYADDIASSYFTGQHQDGASPEECAQADISYWGD
jgi:hypothetical protein